MRVHLLVVLVTTCVDLEAIDPEKSASEESLEALIEESTCSMSKCREQFIENNKKIREQLTLTPKQKKELQSSLKLLRRKSIDEVQPAVQSIEEVNMESGVIDELFQIDSLQSKRVRVAFRKAARLWSTNTCIDIKEVMMKEIEEDEDEEDELGDDGDEPQDDSDSEHYDDYGDYEEEEYDVNLEEEVAGEDAHVVILVDDIKGCSSSVGRKPFFRRGEQWYQVISLAKKCETIGVAAHEIGHALGFWHAQSRHDRDEFITIVAENINENYSEQFVKQTTETNNNYGLPYDYGSIMHYGSTSGAYVKGATTMLPKDVLYTETLGSPIISFYDILMMNMHYNCTEVCKKYTTPRKNGGFAHPRDCSKCICPSGYDGNFCDRKPQGCGKELNATRKWRTLKNNPQAMVAGAQDGYKRCWYWIEAPNDTKMQIEIVKLPQGVAVDGCIYAGVEIKTHPDKRHTGYRFRSKEDVGIILTSTSNVVVVIIFARRRRNITSTMLKYRYI